MARLTASEARRRLFELLNLVEAGATSVVLERRGVRSRIVLDEAPVPAPDQAPHLPPPSGVLDEMVEKGEWTWVADESGFFVLESPAEEPPFGRA